MELLPSLQCKLAGKTRGECQTYNNEQPIEAFSTLKKSPNQFCVKCAIPTELLPSLQCKLAGKTGGEC